MSFFTSALWYTMLIALATLYVLNYFNVLTLDGWEAWFGAWVIVMLGFIFAIGAWLHETQQNSK